MRIPGLMAENSIYKTAIQYRMTAISTSNGLVLPRQVSFGICVANYGSCYEQCGSLGFPLGCADACEVAFEACASGIGEGGVVGGRPGAGAPRSVESSGCFQDRTSSTGWRVRDCTRVIGVGGGCTWAEECPAPGCSGPCRCVCTQQCFRYGPVSGNTIMYSAGCTP